MTLRRELGLVPLVAVVFFNVSGGPYGIEDTVLAFGPGLTLVLLVLTPLVWSLPVALAMSELASALPDEGGYVTWTTRAFGRFWGFQVGWWSWIDSFVDVAVYPALFVEYVRFWYPSMTALERWILAVMFIAALTGLNLAGIRPVGRAAVALAIAALVPIAVLALVASASAFRAPWIPFAAESHTVVGGLGLGLAVVMWNYSGWDTPSTCLGETRHPERAFRLAQWIALWAIGLGYVVPIALALATTSLPWTEWKTGTLPLIAEGIAGAWLGHVVALGAVVSAAGLFMSLLLTNSRLPYVLARDGLLPRGLARVENATGTPAAAVIASSIFYAIFAAFSFKDLVVLNVWLYSLSLIVELGAFLWLRHAEPALSRPWRVPGGWPGAVTVVAVPVALSLAAMATAGWLNTIAGVIAALTGPAAYAVWARRDFRR